MDDMPNEKKKRKWSAEARQKASERHAQRYGKVHDPLPSILREKELIASREEAKEEIDEGISEVEDMREDKYISKRSFDYDSGLSFEHGQVVDLRGLPNDEKLIRLGYLLPYKSDGSEDKCIHCGKAFGSTSGYIMHVAKHNEMCSRCNKKVAPDEFQRHMEAHTVLA